MFILLCSTAASLPRAAAAQPGESQTGDSKSATDDDVEPGATSTTVVVVPPASGDTTVVTQVVTEPVETGRIEGRHRLHIDADVLSWRRTTPWRDEDDMTGLMPSAVDSVNVLGGTPVLGMAGLGPAGNFGIGYAYGVTDRIIVGARLGLGFQHLSTPAPDRQATGMFGYWLTPYFEFVGRPGHRVRPFVGVRIGFGGSVSASKNGDVTARASTIGPIFGLGLGLHAFITERVSLDPAITFDYAMIWGRGVVKPPQMGMEPETWERTAMVPNVGLMLGLSVWLGRDDDDDRRRRR